MSQMLDSRQNIDRFLQYEWLLNDQPLAKGHRFALSQEFGFAALNILYIYPEDSGTYTLVIRNPAGEARSSVQIECEPKEGLLHDTFHPSAVCFEIAVQNLIIKIFTQNFSKLLV